MRAAFFTLGCKVNQYESQAMAQSLERRGFAITDYKEEADVYVVNSCVVTAEGERKTRRAVRRFKNTRPDSAVVLTGCMPQAFPDAAKSLNEADIVLGNRNNERLYEYIIQFMNSRRRIFAIKEHEPDEKFSGASISDFRGRTRAVLKIEDGCDRFCSYCVIPYARGRVRSKSLTEIGGEVEALEKKGFHEITLVGINLSLYGSDIGSTLADAARRAAGPDGIKRVRLGSLEPEAISDDVITALAGIPKLCPHFHLSLQSGCDETLKRMNRRYDSAEYYGLCLKLRSAFPGASVTTDVMVGFPGETGEEFERSLKFVEKAGFEKVHVFPYSIRPGTAAAGAPNQIPGAEKERRAAVMNAAAEKLRKTFLKNQTGKILEVLPESGRGEKLRGYSSNYAPVEILNAPPGVSGPVKVKIFAADGVRCIGEYVPE